MVDSSQAMREQKWEEAREKERQEEDKATSRYLKGLTDERLKDELGNTTRLDDKKRERRRQLIEAEQQIRMEEKERFRMQEDARKQDKRRQERERDSRDLREKLEEFVASDVFPSGSSIDQTLESVRLRHLENEMGDLWGRALAKVEAEEARLMREYLGEEPAYTLLTEMTDQQVCEEAEAWHTEIDKGRKTFPVRLGQ
jgi:hypothetical protein